MVDLNPLHWINKANHAFGDTVASGLEFLGITDPAVDPDGIREIAKQWRSLAKGLDAAAHAAETALKDLEWEGKAAKALHKRAKATRKQATDMADSLREGAKALDDFADEAHELLSEIGVILAEIAEFEIASLGLSVLTGGLSVIAGNLAAGARAAKVVALIARIEKSGTRMASVIRTVMEAIRGLERALKALGEIKTIAKAGKLAGEGMKFAAFDTLLKDPATFKDPDKLAETLAMGAAFGVGIGGLGKVLGKGLGKLKPSELAKLGQTLGLNGSGLTRLKLRPSEWEKLPASIRSMFKKVELDPIDVATGDMLLPQTDAELPGTLPLVLERTHISSYRWGGWFGPTWASTLDQRLQVDEDGIVYAAPDGARLTYPHPEAGRSDPVYPEFGPRIPLTWDTEVDGALRLTDPDSGHSYVFHSPHPAADEQAVDLPLQSIQDRNGQHITVHYADDGTPVEIAHCGGYRIALDRHRDLPRITRLRLLDPEQPESPGTVLISYGYNEKGHLTEVTNSSGRPMRFTYDEAGRITSWTDRNDSRYTYHYDDRGRVVRTEGSNGFLSGTLNYDDDTRTTVVTNSLGHTACYEHNEALRLIRETNPLGHTTLQEWDTEHRLTAVTDPLGHTTRYTYDAQGRVTSIRLPDGTELSREYNELGLPTAITEPDGARWSQEYDERGNRTRLTDPAGATTHYQFTTAGHLASVTDAMGHTLRVRTDPAGLPIEVTDPLGARTTYERDQFGRPLTLTDPMGAATRLTWTTEGKLASRTLPDGTREAWEYDGEGNCTTHIDPLGGTSHFEYTHFDMLAARTGPDGARYTFEHDTELRLTQVTNPQGMKWSYTYDPAGRLISETDFDGRSLTYTHDTAGRLAARTTAAGHHILYERDSMGRTRTKNAAGAITSYAYDAAGRLIQASVPEATVTLEHDAAGRLVTETVNGCTTTFTHDLLGRRTSRTTPTGATSTYTYDAAGYRTHLVASGRTVTFEHDAAGRELSRRIGDHLTVASTFDPLGRLTSHTVTKAADVTVQQRTYTYRADGHLTALHDEHEGPRRFDLDATGRVTAVHASGWTENYAYDELGNQTHATWPPTHPSHEATGPRAYTGTRITRAGQIRYEHDTAGRIVLRQRRRLSHKADTWRYTWDAEDRLTSVITPDGTLWRYLYDALGRRIAKLRLADDGETVVERTDFTWDGTTLCEQTTTSAETSNPVTLTWDHQGHHAITQTERTVAADTPQDEIDSRFFAIVTDLVGAPTELLDEAGDIAWRTRSTLWGNTSRESANTASTPLRFPGQYFDTETGLHYNFFRHYDPETARYLTSDPLGLTPAPNPDTYVSNPHTWADPLGLAPDACPYRVEPVPEGELSSLFHYTNEKGYKGILESGELRASLKADNPKDARFGDGQYLSDIKPGTKTPGQLSYAFVRVPWAGHKFSHFIEVDVRGLGVMRSVERPDVFVVPNKGSLDLAGRIVKHGKS